MKKNTGSSAEFSFWKKMFWKMLRNTEQNSSAQVQIKSPDKMPSLKMLEEELWTKMVIIE